MQDTENSTRPRWYWNIPIIVLIGILVPLGVRGMVLDDARYSWGTFCKQVVYRVNYRWVVEMPSGKRKTVEHIHADELRGEAAVHLAGRSKKLNTRYSLGAVKSWLAAYTQYMFENRDEFFDPPEGEVIGFTADVEYRVNVSRRLRERELVEMEKSGNIPPPQRLFFAYPVEKDARGDKSKDTPADSTIMPHVKEDDA